MSAEPVGKYVAEMSDTCPVVEVMPDHVRISDHEVVTVNYYDLDALIEDLTLERDKLRDAGHKTAWSNDADGNGNCGAIVTPPVRWCSYCDGSGIVP